GVRLGNAQWQIRPRDLLQFGEVAIVVDGIEETEESQPAPAGPASPASPPLPVPAYGTSKGIITPTTGVALAPHPAVAAADDMRVEATTKSSWDQALEGL